MLLAFTLSMPRINTWNNRWSGENKVYARIRSFGAKSKAAGLAEQSFYYDFGDGWTARVDVEKVDAKGAAKLRKQSAGFMGYDWMIASLLDYGEILNTEQQHARELESEGW